MIMNDEFWDVVGSEVEEGRVWRCHRYLDDAWTADQETQLFDVICGYAITDKSGDKVKDQCQQCGFYRLACLCGGSLFCFRATARQSRECHYSNC